MLHHHDHLDFTSPRWEINRELIWKSIQYLGKIKVGCGGGILGGIPRAYHLISDAILRSIGIEFEIKFEPRVNISDLKPCLKSSFYGRFNVFKRSLKQV